MDERVGASRTVDGAVIDERHEVIKDMFESGAVRALHINDGFAREPFAGATFRIAAAEALVPMAERDDAAAHYLIHSTRLERVGW